jgi:trans-aconitate methyltransferase
VPEAGCGRGDLSAALRPSYGVAVDFSPASLETTRQRHPGIPFKEASVHEFTSAKEMLLLGWRRWRKFSSFSGGEK